MTKVVTNPKSLQLTLAVIKPHVVPAPHALKAIREVILSNQFFVIRSKRQALTKHEIEQFYQEHANKFYYHRLVTFMSSGPSDLHILAKDNAISSWRQLMGPTKSYQAHFSHPDTIRGTWGLSDTRNAAHGSDSAESVRREIGIFFPEFSIDHWMLEKKQCFENNLVEFDENSFTHKIKEQLCENLPLDTFNNHALQIAQ